MGLNRFLGRWRLVLLLGIAFLVVLTPVVELAGSAYSPTAVSAKGGKGHGTKAKKQKNKGKRNHGENGENKGKGKKKGHNKIEPSTQTAAPLAQLAVTPAPTPPPSELPATTGSILVLAYDCPAGVNLETVDWYTECTTTLADVTFRLVMNGAPAESATTGATDEQGQLTFTDLDPGMYQLTEDDGNWCHAESDNVDDNGDVVVRADEQATVWIFHCPAAITS